MDLNTDIQLASF